MTDAEKLLRRYDMAVAKLDMAVLHPDSSKYTVAQTIMMVEKERTKLLKALEGEGNGKG